MFLRRVLIEHFRGIGRVEVELDRSTVLVGENNAGKSTFIDAIRLCLDRPLSRRGSVFDDYDHHLRDGTASFSDAAPVAVTLDFAETRADEWPDPVIQALDGVVCLDADDCNHVVLRVSGRFDPATGEFVSDADFLNTSGQPINVRGRKLPLVAELLRLKPLFHLPAVRDAAREFQPRGTLWGRLLRSPAMSPEARQELEGALAELNARIVSSEPRLTHLQESLEKVARLVRLSGDNPVGVQAISGNIWDVLSRAQISIGAATGARLPLTRHGSGTQSLAVVFLFEAFLSVMLAQEEAQAVPLLTVEEPEAHLHPTAVRGVWHALEEIPGQKLVATHSGDLLAETTLTQIRRFYRSGNEIKVGRLNRTTLTPEEVRKLDLHVRKTRGELLFARCWLLVEGATEYWVLSEVARLVGGQELECRGVRIVPFAQVGLVPFVKLADDLGIPWHALVDGDQAGANTRRALAPVLNGRAEADLLTALPHDNFEVHLCESGYGAVYLNHLSPQRSRDRLTAAPGAADYWPQVVQCLNEKVAKERLAIDAMLEMQRTRTPPPLLERLVRRVLALAEQ